MVPLLPTATTTQRKIPPEPYESGGGRKAQQDRPTRQRTQERNIDPRLMETCVVCNGSYKKGRGLKIHQKKSGCYRKLPDPHRNESKSVDPNFQDTNHSEVRRQADQDEGATKRIRNQKEERKEEKKEEIEGKPREQDTMHPKEIGTEKEEERIGDSENQGKPHEEDTKQSSEKEKGEQEENKRDSERLEIHVDASLYTEVDSWLNKTLKEGKK